MGLITILNVGILYLERNQSQARLSLLAFQSQVHPFSFKHSAPPVYIFDGAQPKVETVGCEVRNLLSQC